ncbi:hypothetical protein FRC02_001842 [Tulasnella sp. 418]|nr:hypothetical protein FRC02_001842 [Tulasnella sp. 418]
MAEPSDPSVPVDDAHCLLLGPTALVVQGLMGIVVLLSLVYKRHREKPMRPWRIWLFDVSKQIAGQIVVHIFNLGISDLVSRPSSGNNPCTAYFMNVTFDVTVGVVIIWAVLHGLTNLLTNKFHLIGFQSGSYGNPPSLVFWAKQAAVYIVAIVSMKLVVLIVFTLFPSTFRVGDWLLSWTGGRGQVQVVFVLGIYPIFMNILQFWIIDSIVKASVLLLDLDTHNPATSPDRQRLVDSLDEPYSSDEDDDVQDRHSNHVRKPSDEESHLEGRTKNISSSGNSRSSSLERKSTSSKHRQRSLVVGVEYHDYPPSTSSSRRGSPQPRRRSPPPSPSPIATPSAGYGSMDDSPRMLPTSRSDAVAGWEWNEQRDSEEDTRPLPPVRKESWNMPTIASPTK